MNSRKQRWSESGALKCHKYTIEYGAARAAVLQAVVVVVGGQVCDSVVCSYVAVGSLQTRKVKDGLSSEAPRSTLPGPCSRATRVLCFYPSPVFSFSDSHTNHWHVECTPQGMCRARGILCNLCLQGSNGHLGLGVDGGLEVGMGFSGHEPSMRLDLWPVLVTDVGCRTHRPRRFWFLRLHVLGDLVPKVLWPSLISLIVPQSHFVVA